ncbi:phosphotransferase family protein [Virgibacillus soli]|uniref:Phosphotransferase family protein n=1 Tax=Paracerasibacillus soli TaxID=480284 RepID=A0ABU5CSB6_9BACI|nr:phosphotransferase family protein [Virgibacillus soli]MDY0408732.1 phosphotransferase family protein [Virgibacillus soli]
MNWFKHILDKDWEISTAGGMTGDAYIAKKGERRLFLKRNSSPFLAVLSAEGIVPKLMWTKRMDNGDVITAQEWLDGRVLKPEEMQQFNIASLLRKIHESPELLHMMMRLGKKPVTSDALLEKVEKRLNTVAAHDSKGMMEQSLAVLKQCIPLTRNTQHTVCHGDLDHHNMLLTNSGKVYLIDWENAKIADPVIDYGTVLQRYVPKILWEDWLKHYGIKTEQHLFERMYWYLIVDTLTYLLWHIDRNEQKGIRKRMADLDEMTTTLGKLI